MGNKRVQGSSSATYTVEGTTLKINYQCPYCGTWTCDTFELGEEGLELAISSHFYEVCTCGTCGKDADVFPCKA